MNQKVIAKVLYVRTQINANIWCRDSSHQTGMMMNARGNESESHAAIAKIHARYNFIIMWKHWIANTKNNPKPESQRLQAMLIMNVRVISLCKFCQLPNWVRTQCDRIILKKFWLEIQFINRDKQQIALIRCRNGALNTGESSAFISKQYRNIAIRLSQCLSISSTIWIVLSKWNELGHFSLWIFPQKPNQRMLSVSAIFAWNISRVWFAAFCCILKFSRCRILTIFHPTQCETSFNYLVHLNFSHKQFFASQKHFEFHRKTRAVFIHQHNQVQSS